MLGTYKSIPLSDESTEILPQWDRHSHYEVIVSHLAGSDVKDLRSLTLSHWEEPMVRVIVS